MSNATLVSTTVNGDPVQFACPTDESLMTALRNRVGRRDYAGRSSNFHRWGKQTAPDHRSLLSKLMLRCS